MDSEISEQSESDNFSESELYDYESAVYVSLPCPDVESENEDINLSRRRMPKRKCTRRQQVVCVPKRKIPNRQTVSQKSVAASNHTNRIPNNDNKTASKKPSTKTTKKIPGNVTSQAPINDNKTAIVTSSTEISKKVSGNRKNQIPINDNKAFSVTPSAETSKKFSGNRSNQAPINSSKIRSKKAVLVIAKSAASRAKKRNMKVNIKTNKWINGDFEKTTKFPKRDKEFGKYSSLSPTELFELFFTDDIWDHILVETTKYAHSNNCDDPKITKSELKCFFGILIASGYNILPGKKFYWDRACDMRIEFVSDSMRRERFVTIMRFMHWADNSQMSSEDKVWKIRPVIEVVNGYLELGGEFLRVKKGRGFN